MNRAFLSLYFIVIIFITLMGWGLDKLWQHFSPPPLATVAQLELLNLTEQYLADGKTPPVLPTTQLSLFAPDDFANSSLSEALASGQPLVLHNQHGEIEIYKRSLATPHIIRLTLPNEPHNKRRNYVYEVLLTLFYGSIGLAVFIWVWPLMRDVRKLEQQTQHIGRNTLPKPISVMPGSAVGNLAHAFNNMSERIKELLASHKEMTYAVSHELRTPLARMKFALTMLQESSLQDGKGAQPCSPAHLNSLRQDIDEMDSLITQLLTYAGYEHESGPLVQESGDMAFLVSELIRRAKDSHQDKSIQVFLECDDADTKEPAASTTASTASLRTTPANAMATHMQCDWHLMERAIFNLIHNAMRFARMQVIVTLRSDKNKFYVCVEDDGPGIPDGSEDKVFESFVRLNNSVNIQSRGFGLGLAIVKRVLKWHEGSATVTRGALGGALFILAWPKQKH